MALVIFVFVLLGLAFLQREPVSHVEIPAAEPPAPGPLITASPPTDPVEFGELQGNLEKVAASYPGVYGVVVFEPYSDKSVALNAHRTFEAASRLHQPGALCRDARPHDEY